MDDLLNPQLITPLMFITHIGLSLAAFAFLCNYLVFPKTLLSDVSHIILRNPPRITDSRVLSRNHVSVNEIIGFFHEIDVITYSILMFILYSSLASLICFGVRLGAINPEFGRISALVFTALQFSTNYSILIDNVVNNGAISEDDWNSRSRLIYSMIDSALQISFLIFAWAALCLWKSGLHFFILLILYLILLFIWYLLPIAKRRPVSNLLRIWVEIGNLSKPIDEVFSEHSRE